MTLDALLAAAHHLAAFGLVAAMYGRLLLLGSVPSGQRLTRLAQLEAACALLALAVLVAGGLRLVFGPHGWAHYAAHPLWWAKLAAFGLALLLAVQPSRRLLRWRRQSALPDTIALDGLRPVLLAQLGLLALMPLLAALMVHGAARL